MYKRQTGPTAAPRRRSSRNHRKTTRLGFEECEGSSNEESENDNDNSDPGEDASKDPEFTVDETDTRDRDVADQAADPGRPDPSLDNEDDVSDTARRFNRVRDAVECPHCGRQGTLERYGSRKLLHGKVQTVRCTHPDCGSVSSGAKLEKAISSCFAQGNNEVEPQADSEDNNGKNDKDTSDKDSNETASPGSSIAPDVVSRATFAAMEARLAAFQSEILGRVERTENRMDSIETTIAGVSTRVETVESEQAQFNSSIDGITTSNNQILDLVRDVQQRLQTRDAPSASFATPPAGVRRDTPITNATYNGDAPLSLIHI